MNMPSFVHRRNAARVHWFARRRPVRECSLRALRVWDAATRMRSTREPEELQAIRGCGGSSLGFSFERFRTHNLKEGLAEGKLLWARPGVMSNMKCLLCAVHSRHFTFDNFLSYPPRQFSNFIYATMSFWS